MSRKWNSHIKLDVCEIYCYISEMIKSDLITPFFEVDLLKIFQIKVFVIT